MDHCNCFQPSTILPNLPLDVAMCHPVVFGAPEDYLWWNHRTKPEGVLPEPKFKTTAINPFTELAELRFEMKARGDEFDVQCRLIFGKMHHEHNNREYEIGLRRAYLRLNLEGCETTLESAFGENELPSVIEEDELESSASLGASISGAADTSGAIGSRAQMEIGANGTRRQSNTQKRERLPMTRKPGDSWEVVVQSVLGSANADLVGTAMSGQKLCSLRRKDGGNRLAATGEVQIAKSAIAVSAKGGNQLGKALSEWQNKDAIVSQILRRALQREAIGGAARTLAKVVVVSRAEVSEE